MAIGFDSPCASVLEAGIKSTLDALSCPIADEPPVSIKIIVGMVWLDESTAYKLLNGRGPDLFRADVQVLRDTVATIRATGMEVRLGFMWPRIDLPDTSPVIDANGGVDFPGDLFPSGHVSESGRPVREVTNRILFGNISNNLPSTLNGPVGLAEVLDDSGSVRIATVLQPGIDRFNDFIRLQHPGSIITKLRLVLPQTDDQTQHERWLLFLSQAIHAMHLALPAIIP